MFIQRNNIICDVMNGMELKICAFGHAVLEESERKMSKWLPFSRLYLILRGSFSVKTKEGNIVQLKAGEGYLIPGKAQFEYICEEETEFLYFHVHWGGIDYLDMLSEFRETVYPLGAVTTWYRTAQNLVQKESRSVPEGLWLKNQISALLLPCIEKEQHVTEAKPYSQCVVRAFEYIHRNLSMTMEFEDVANYAYVARKTLTRFFHDEVHLSLTDYTYVLIWIEACYMLSNTTMTQQQISETLGFIEQGYFSRQFMAWFQMRPGEYRKRALV